MNAYLKNKPTTYTYFPGCSLAASGHENNQSIHRFCDRIEKAHLLKNGVQSLNGIRFAPYYGCMLAKPPILSRDKSHYGILESTLKSLGADPVSWPHFAKCCGTYLSVAKPASAAKVVDQIMSSAVAAGAECLVTACAMCHLNLEIRCTLDIQIPTFHFSELLCLAFGVDDHARWFQRHIVDPEPLLRQRQLI